MAERQKGIDRERQQTIPNTMIDKKGKRKNERQREREIEKYNYKQKEK